MKRICLLVLVGLPAAGKTSFCRWLLNLKQQQFQVVHFCYDRFLDVEQLRQSATTTNDAYKMQRLQIFETLKTVVQIISLGKDIPVALQTKINISPNDAKDDVIVLLDDNFYYRSMRYKIYQHCKNKALAFAQIYFECHQQTSLLRNAKRSMERLPDSVIEKMAARLEPPDAFHHWEITTLKIMNDISPLDDEASMVVLKDLFFTTDFSKGKANASVDGSYDNMIDLILNFMSAALDNIPKNDISAGVENQATNSLLHSLDILLRRRITQLLSCETCKDVKRTRAAALNERRKEILGQYRCFVLVEERLSEIVDLMDDNKNYDI